MELAVSKFVTERGFPLIHYPDHPTAPSKIIELTKMPRMQEEKRRDSLNKIETPIDGFNQVINRWQKAEK